jgi:predicted nucleotide-binding protein
LSSSIKYGLTAGSFNVDRVSIAATGKEIVEPLDAESRTKSLVAAFLTPPTFRAVYDAFRGKKLPEPEFFRNALVRDFGVPREHAAKCAEIFIANVEFLRLVNVTSTGRWLSSEPSRSPLPNAEVTPKPDPTGVGDDPATDAAGELPDPPLKNGGGEGIFIGHGKNRKPLEQLEKILSEYKIPVKVAINEANQARPISAKVAETMKACSAAILIFTPDEEFQDRDGKTVWKPSENAVFELGAASVLYGKRVVIFKEDSVTFPSNFKDIGYISFKGDDLAAKTNELFRELISFGVIKVTVG